MIKREVSVERIQRAGIYREEDGIWKVMINDGDVWKCVTETDVEMFAKSDYRWIVREIKQRVKELNKDGKERYEARISNGGNTIRIHKVNK